MDRRRIFTLDPERFPAHLVKDLVDTIHARDQHYIVMVDPAVYYPESNPALDEGLRYDAFLKEANGTNYQGVVWAGPSYFPDWFEKNSQQYWNEQFVNFFDGVNGPDIDALWIDMNEVSGERTLKMELFTDIGFTARKLLQPPLPRKQHNP
jgi:alpha-glucosidase